MAVARLRVCVHRFILICSCFIFFNFSSTTFSPAHQHFGRRSQLGGCVFLAAAFARVRSRCRPGWLAGRADRSVHRKQACRAARRTQVKGHTPCGQRNKFYFIYFSKNGKRLPDVLAFALPLRLGRQPTHCDVTKGTSGIC